MIKINDQPCCRYRSASLPLYMMPASNLSPDAEKQSGSIIKKRRTNENGPSTSTLSIHDLPDAALVTISEFCNPTSRILLPVALTASSEEWCASKWMFEPCSSAKAILNEPIPHFTESDMVDFTGHQTDQELTSRLSDADIGGVLACVGSVRPFGQVWMGDCVNMSGCGLEPLRGCTTLTMLDLSLTHGIYCGFDHPKDPKISAGDVIPILESIIATDECSLKNVRFPKKLREERSQLMLAFFSKFNDEMDERTIPCAHCAKICRGTEKRPWISPKKETFGVNNFTCHCCSKSYCQECADEDVPAIVCERCKTMYCAECYLTGECEVCKETTCHLCTGIRRCCTCKKTGCLHCVPISDMIHCEYCDKAKCSGCAEFDICQEGGCWNINCVECSVTNHGAVKWCSECEILFCGKHLIHASIVTDEGLCSDCNTRAALYLSELNKEMGEWLQKLEQKYGNEGPDCWTSPTGNLSRAIEVREEIFERCFDVGDSMRHYHLRDEGFEWRMDRFRCACNFWK